MTTTTDTLTELKALRDARELIADPSHWVKGCSKIPCDSSSASTDPHDYRYCMMGAVAEVTMDCADSDEVYGNISARIMDRVDRVPVFFNDDYRTTHDDVLAAMDATIADLEAEAIA